MFAPCKGCPDRQVEPVNCHSVCEKYLAYREQCQQVYRKRALQNMVEQTTAEACLRMKRYKKLPRGRRHEY